MLENLAVTDHILNLEKNEIAPKTLFYKKQESGRQILRKRVLSLYFFILFKKKDV